MTKLTLKDGISLLTFLGGVVLTIYGLGVKNANKDNNTAKIENSVIEQNQSIKNLTLKVEGLDNSLELNSENLINLIKEYEKLHNSVNALALKVADSPLEFAKIMEGKTFEVVQEEPMKSIFP